MLVTGVVGASFFACSTSHAATEVAQSSPPVVSGSTITVAQDGWYQFQNSETFVELCAGTFECTVPPGSYIVINHSNQQRWESIEVTSQASAGIPLIEGLEVHFPDDGWYQVQDSISYQSECNGLSTCALQAGSYNVINHTSGQRWNSVGVSDNTNMFLLPNMGWYQVQSATDYTSVCEGVTRCIVAPGAYNVINHSAGSRYDAILVRSVDDDSPGVAQPLLTLSAANAENMVKNIISVINEEQIEAFFNDAQNDLAFQGRQFFLSNTIDDIVFSQSTNLDAPYQLETSFGTGAFSDIPARSEYTCASGGTVYSYSSDRVFNECVAGENTYSGTTGRRNDMLRGTIRNYPFWDFSATDTSGRVSSLTGGYSIGNLSFVVLNQTKRWAGGQFTTTLNDGSFSLTDFNIERLDKSDVGLGFDTTTRVIDGIPYTIRNNSQNSSINGSFVVAAGWTNQDPVTVNVSLSFSDTIRELADSTVTDYPGTVDPIDPFQWQAGTITISASDGSSLTVKPTIPSAQSFSIELSNGESIGPLLWSDGYTINCGSLTLCDY